MLDVAIVGGGVSGLYLATCLEQQGVDYALFEARNRFGGRVLSNVSNGQSQTSSQDLGPTWIWPHSQPRIARFIAEQQLTIFPHWVHGNALYKTQPTEMPYAYVDSTSYVDACRIHGGTYMLIQALLNKLPNERLHLGQRLQTLKNRDQFVTLQLQGDQETVEVNAKRVVLSLPPRLLQKHVTFQPELDPRILELFQQTPTWMAGQAKAIIRYERPFWREKWLSGNALANYPGATLVEIFDSANEDGSAAALGGFFALSAGQRHAYSQTLESLLIEQLVSFFGEEAANPIGVNIHDWSDEPYTATESDAEIPMQHPQYGHQWLQLDHWTDRLYFCGTETASQHGGYLEGAFESAERVAHAIAV